MKPNVKVKSLFILMIYTLFVLIPKKSNANEKDLYDFMWLDPDKKVYVLQNKVHKKEKTTYANIGVGTNLSSTFQNTSSFYANIGYNLSEEIAIEAIYLHYSNSDNEALQNLKKLNGSTPFIRKPKNSMGAMIKWSPFYGKINTFNKIIYFDWAFGLGMGSFETESNATTVAISNVSDRYIKEKYTSILGKTELTIHASKNIHFNLGLISNTYRAPGPTIKSIEGKSSYRSNIDTILSVGISF